MTSLFCFVVVVFVDVNNGGTSQSSRKEKPIPDWLKCITCYHAARSGTQRLQRLARQRLNARKAVALKKRIRNVRTLCRNVIKLQRTTSLQRSSIYMYHLLIALFSFGQEFSKNH